MQRTSALDGTLDAARMRALMKSGEYGVLAAKAVAIESRTNLLFSFEKWLCATPSADRWRRRQPL